MTRSFMTKTACLAGTALLAACASPTASDDISVAEAIAAGDELCLDMGPQTPRDISRRIGTNPVSFATAPPAREMNLCNIHTHTSAEHKGPGFSLAVENSPYGPDYGGFACNDTASLTPAELAPAPGAFGKVAPGDTIEVHWVHTSCDTDPGEGLGSCIPETCTDPILRVEAQTFLVVNDGDALDFTEMDYQGFEVNGLDRAKMIPANTGDPVTFLGSTTGTSYDDRTCSPARVTWNVRPQCAKLDINSLHAWAADNVFNETESQGIRKLVTAPGMLSEIR